MFIFTDEFAELQKVTISFVMSVYLSAFKSVRLKQLDYHWKDFQKKSLLSIFHKYVDKFKIR
jgi:hypothetical protein